MKNLYAYTEDRGYYPGFISVNLKGDSVISFSVRGTDETLPGLIELTQEQSLELARSILGEFPVTPEFDFGTAVQQLKLGKKVCRAGWNGKGMHLKYIPTEEYAISIEVTGGQIHPLLPWIGMKTADNCFVPWLASQTDVLAEDWMLV